MNSSTLILLAPNHHQSRASSSSLGLLLPSDSRFPPFLPTIEELHSLPEHEYVSSLNLIYSAQAAPLKPQPLTPLSEAFALPPRSVARTNPRVRRLVASINLSDIASMPIDSAPTSPPDLTTSKSSRASSIVSSTLSDIAGPTDISHFEDIGLDDGHAVGSLHQAAMSNEMLYPGISSLSSGAQRRLLDKRPSMTSLGSRASSHSSFRDLTNSGKRPMYPGLQGQSNGVKRDAPTLGPPTRMRRGFTTGSSSSLPIHPAHRSRSPSPVGPAANYRSSSRGSASSRRSSNSTVGVSPSLSISRRTSWQSTRRKSAQELEAEYDDKDNDDNDIPEDAFVVNIPISPRMPHERPSPSPSRSNSPARNGMSPYLSQRASAPASFPDQRTYKPAPPTDKSPATINELESVEEVPRAERTLSYSSVLSALDEDARVLTEALEEHATEREAKREEEIQRGNRPISLDKTGSNSKIDLPPLQKPSVMMDPLPMSKEKEAALSRTRPSHLPPKSKEEEEKHLKEYKKMMAAAQEAEKKRMSRLKADLDKKDLEERSKIDVWRQLILPRWDEYRTDKRTRELWWRGVPPACRGRAWLTGIGNELALTHESYRLALDKAKEQLPISQGDGGEHPILKKIERLHTATYPKEKLFQHNMPCYQPLHDVLLAYSMYRPDVSLFQGMSNLIALLVLNLDPPDAFIALANALNRSLPMAILLRDAARITTAYENVLKLMHIKLPHLYTHLFEKLRLHPDEFLGTMFEGLMLGRMSIDNACRMWDAIVFEGDRIFTRAAVGMLSIVEAKLYTEKDEILGTLGRNRGTEILIEDNPDEFAFAIRAAGKIK